MNKLLGFYELKESRLPAIEWKEYKPGTVLREDILWTVRSAVYSGEDLNLPRKVGIEAKDAMEFANQLYSKLKDKGMVVYYPYFVADKSGTLQVSWNINVIEAVKDDLWNLVTYSKRDVTLQFIDGQEIVDGDENFLSTVEKQELLKYTAMVKHMFRDELLEGKDALLEWSYAYESDIEHRPIGDRKLVFYEARTI